MDLKEFDGKLVKLIDLNDEVWEGYVDYFDEEYSEHEYGKHEEVLQMINMLFFKNQIKSIDVTDDFSEQYGLFEKTTIEDGVISIEEVFESENDIHILRLLMCLKDYLKNNEVENREELEEVLKKLVDHQLGKINIDKDKLMEELQ